MLTVYTDNIAAALDFSMISKYPVV